MAADRLNAERPEDLPVQRDVGRDDRDLHLSFDLGREAHEPSRQAVDVSIVRHTIDQDSVDIGGLVDRIPRRLKREVARKDPLSLLVGFDHFSGFMVSSLMGGR